MAAFVGSIAIVTVPVTDVAAGPPNPPVIQGTPSTAERSGPPVATVPAHVAKPVPAAKPAGHKRDASRPRSGDSSGGVQDLLPSVDSPVPLPAVPSVSIPSVTLPSATLPPLPVEPPTVQLPPPPDTGLLD